MSNRTLVELNHDYCPVPDAAPEWGERIARYMRSGNREFLPQGVEWIELRHHSDRGIIAAQCARIAELEAENTRLKDWNRTLAKNADFQVEAASLVVCANEYLRTDNATLGESLRICREALDSERTRWQQKHALFVESDASNTQLAGELEAAKADTKRLDCLETGLKMSCDEHQVHRHGCILLYRDGKLMQLISQSPNDMHWKSISWREAIDSAMRSQEPPASDPTVKDSLSETP